mmetsp:Transcript_10798/g.24381  ORF Transcript_10798/g.24381 Transcript_10798/m.24381 type:complete len:388 (-) Transcript_10798:118-1281(-)
MGRLRSYIRSVQEKLQAATESDLKDLHDAEVADMVSDVTISLMRLSSGAPGETRLKIRNALLTAGVQAVVDVLDPPDGEPEPEAQEEEAEESPDEATEVEAGDEVGEPGDVAGPIAKLWELEQDFRLVPGADVTLSTGTRAASLSTCQDRCEDPLFESVDEEKLMTPLTRAFQALLDNYERETSSQEVVTDAEKTEMNSFLNLLSKTPHFRYVHKVLVAWDKADASMDDFLSNVYSAWFTNYRLGKKGPAASSGFEHVFVGEEKYDYRRKQSVISGFHNWIQFYLEEKKGNVNYLGYVGHTDDDDLVISARFTWDDEDPGHEAKPVSTFLVGTSIAFEFSLATLCFFGLDGDDGSAQVEVGGHSVKVQTYKYHSRMGLHVRTVYLEA